MFSLVDIGYLQWLFKYTSRGWEVFLIGQIFFYPGVLGANRNVSRKLGMKLAIVTINVLWLFFTVPCVGLQYVIVVFLITLTYFLLFTHGEKVFSSLISSFKFGLKFFESRQFTQILILFLFLLFRT